MTEEEAHCVHSRGQTCRAAIGALAAAKRSISKSSSVRCERFIFETTCSIVGDIRLTDRTISATTVEPSIRDLRISIPVSGAKSTCMGSMS